ncbi:MmgE/Prp family protein [Agaricicola taiwanensis]|uniref:MmgE/Prp family protein n=1 Tax=Agaricicola taiwanensis TaxID=591372 RepID=A0A8J3DW25_9RHOB|nr:MmgE/PrpD family protein [Agaricicola taiwanensis]GGE45541.1 MmgE/Prp family protein [Agaricicola taiwanensis]
MLERTQAAATAEPDFAFTLAEFASSLTLDALPPDVIAAAKTNIFDTLACAVAGTSAPVVAETLELVREWGGAGQATVVGFGDRVPAHHAAWINGTIAHARDYDDTHDEAVLHAGVSVVPAALAAAELSGTATGADVLAGVVAGLETVCRLGVATSIGIIESGYMYTSLFGHFGATVAAARVLRLDRAQTINAIGIGYSQVAGNHQVTRDAALTKRMQPGFAAKAALVSAQLARKGVRGVQHSFDGLDGFLRVYLRGLFDSGRLRDDLGTRFEFLNLSYKPYPCCRFDHTAIDAALAAKAAGVEAAAIRRVEVGVNRQAYQAVCTPVEIRKAPRTIVEAQFSIPFTVAAALVDGELKLSHLTDEGLQRADILALAARVDGVVDDEIERDWSRNISPARVRIELTDGRMIEERVDRPRGGADNPMGVADFDRKMNDCLTFAAIPLHADATARLREAVEHLGDAPDIASLLAPVCR